MPPSYSCRSYTLISIPIYAILATVLILETYFIVGFPLYAGVFFYQCENSYHHKCHFKNIFYSIVKIFGYLLTFNFVQFFIIFFPAIFIMGKNSGFIYFLAQMMAGSFCIMISSIYNNAAGCAVITK